MLIDWFTVIAQVINFLILVWLLKRFLYQPIVSAIDARERRIATELANADAKKISMERINAPVSYSQRQRFRLSMKPGGKICFAKASMGFFWRRQIH